MTGCGYCNNLVSLGNTDNGLLYIDNGKLTEAVCWNYYNDGPSDEYNSIKINYCPMCGRKLEEEK